MRIALIITELHPGGAERCFVSLACFLRQHGHEVAVWELWPPPPIGKRGLVEQLDQHHIPWKSGGANRPRHFPRVAHWLRAELCAFRPDVVQSFLFHANVAAAVATRGMPCGFLGGARVRQPQRWRQRVQRWAAWRMSKLVCVSHSVAEHCQQQERIPPGKLVVIPNGIDLSRTPDAAAHDPIWQRAGVPDDAPVLLFVGRLTEQKGVEDLLRQSADQLLERLPRHHLALIGDGELAPRLAALRETRRHANRIHLLGWHGSAWGCMPRCEMLLLPARYEGMPNAVMEAMALAKPVVSFDVDGIRELLGDTPLADAQIAAPGEFAAFNAAVERLANSPSFRQQCGHSNRQRIAQEFQLDHQLDRYLRLYEQTVFSV